MNFSVLRKSLGVLFVLCSAALYANTATVVSTVGKVEVSRTNVWVALTENEVVREGEVISTGFKKKLLFFTKHIARPSMIPCWKNLQRLIQKTMFPYS